MAHEGKPEVNLEISSGFFRIPTENLVYNLTVIGGGVRVVEKIVEQERRKEAATGGAEPQFFQRVGMLVAGELAAIVRQCAAEPLPGPGLPVDEVRTKLQELRDALQALPAAAPAPAAVDSLPDLVSRIQQASQLLDGLQPSAAATPEPVASPTTRSRYVFDLDVVFQTLYELCTNEQVKTHIATARENRDTYFERDTFLDAINEKVSDLEPDGDNFFNVPMSDVLAALLVACNEKPIRNLLKKMDASQDSIFLDRFLPLEVPPTEEVEEAAPPAEPSVASASPPADDVAGELRTVLAGLQAGIDTLAGQLAGEEPGAAVDTGGLVGKVDDILAMLASGESRQEPQSLAVGRRVLALLAALEKTMAAGERDASPDELFRAALAEAATAGEAIADADQLADALRDRSRPFI